ncbi:MAG: hypothetical protein JW763_05605 [candidate division Zixibacteria bacterium]|nr:hypothetical protein [candidate division Zixibacteria bacterium]
MSVNLRRIQDMLSPGLLPLIWAGLFAIFAILYRFFDFPSPVEIVDWTKALMQTYGTSIVIAAALIEGVFMISVYFPGSLIVVVGVLSSGDGLWDIIGVGTAAWLGFTLALPINYYLGKEGFYRLLLALGRRDTVDQMQLWLQKRGRVAIFLAAFHPNVLAVAAVCMGIGRKGLIRTVILGSLFMIPWLTILLVLLNQIRDRVNPAEGNQIFYVVGALLIWATILIVKERRWAK